MRHRIFIKIVTAVMLFSTTAVIFWISGNQTFILTPQIEDDVPVYDQTVRIKLSDERDFLFDGEWMTSPPIYFVIIVNDTSFDQNKINSPILKYREACAIESASRHNELSTIHAIFVTSDENTNNESAILVWKPTRKNIKMWFITAGKILQNTPLEKWYSERSFQGGKYEITHLSDALRIAILWKHGGIYLDTDIWCVKSIINFRNTIGAENTDHVNGAVMMFDKAHQFLYDVMEEFGKVYNKSEFVVVGPALLTDVLRRKCDVTKNFNSVLLSFYKQCANVSVLDTSYFYPVDFPSNDKFYSGFYRWMYRFYLWRNAYTFHLWNQFTGSKKVKMASFSMTLLEKIAECNCLNVYKLMQKVGNI